MPVRSRPKTQAKAPPKAAAKRMGRPTKGEVKAEQVLAVRVTDADRSLIESIIEDEQRQVEARGGMSGRLTIADVIRSLVRQEAQRRGLLEAPVAQAS